MRHASHSDEPTRGTRSRAILRSWASLTLIICSQQTTSIGPLLGLDFIALGDQDRNMSWPPRGHIASMDFYGPDMTCPTLRHVVRELYPPQCIKHPATTLASREDFEMYFQTGSQYLFAMRDAAKRLYQWMWDSLKMCEALSEDEEAEEAEVLLILGMDV